MKKLSIFDTHGRQPIHDAEWQPTRDFVDKGETVNDIFLQCIQNKERLQNLLTGQVVKDNNRGGGLYCNKHRLSKSIARLLELSCLLWIRITHFPSLYRKGCISSGEFYTALNFM